MTAVVALSNWWDEQPAPVRAVIDLANLEMDEATFDRIVEAFAPGHASAIASIAADLVWVDRLRCEVPCQVLSDYRGQPIHGLYLDVAAERLADELSVGVITQAQLVASLMQVSR